MYRWIDKARLPTPVKMGRTSFFYRKSIHAAEQIMQQESEQELLSSGKLSPALMESYVSRAVEKVTAAQTEEIEVEESLRELREAYPGVKADTVADLAKLPHFDLLRGYVELGLDYREAYALSHQEEIVQQRVAAAKQQALNNANGKGHLTGTQTGDAADVSAVVVPEETMNYYRAFNPSMTDAQIKAHYAKSRKGE